MPRAESGEHIDQHDPQNSSTDLLTSEPLSEQPSSLFQNLRRKVRGALGRIEDGLNNLTGSSQPEFAIAGVPDGNAEGRHVFDPHDPHIEQARNQQPQVQPKAYRPSQYPGYVWYETRGREFLVWENPDGRREQWKRDDKKSRHHPRWFDKPVWALEGLTVGFHGRLPWILDRIYESVPGKARLAAEDPKQWLNQQRLRAANKQEINEVIFSSTRLYVGKWIQKGVTFLKHQANHGFQIVGSLFRDIPIFGPTGAILWSLKSGAPEEIGLNVLEGLISAALIPVEFAASTIPLAGPILVAALVLANYLLNMYLNGSMQRRYDEVNDKAVPFEHDKMLNPWTKQDRETMNAYDNAIKFSQPQRIWRGVPFFIGFFGVKGKKLADKLADSVQRLNYKPSGFGEPSKAQKKYTEEYSDLKDIHLELSALEQIQREQIAARRFWKFWQKLPVIGPEAGIKREIATFKQVFRWIDKGLYFDHEYEFEEALRVWEMVEDVQTRRGSEFLTELPPTQP